MKTTIPLPTFGALLLALCCSSVVAAPAEHKEFEATLHAPFTGAADARHVGVEALAAPTIGPGIGEHRRQRAEPFGYGGVRVVEDAARRRTIEARDHEIDVVAAARERAAEALREHAPELLAAGLGREEAVRQVRRRRARDQNRSVAARVRRTAQDRERDVAIDERQ